jgi:hypothetical protein
MIEGKPTNPKADEIASHHDEVASLHYADVLYWRDDAKQSREAKAE